MKLLCTMSVDWLSLRNLFTQKFVKNKVKLEVFNQNNPSMEIFITQKFQSTVRLASEFSAQTRFPEYLCVMIYLFCYNMIF